ncbi:MAG: hypothetical protein HRU15_17915 [Planctomycetes bacterium]|nr:hypothetical protein [Planctomycetota bacterium]
MHQSFNTSILSIGLSLSCISYMQAVEDDHISDLWRPGSAIDVHSDLRKEKRKDLRNDNWVHSFGLSTQAGYVDNVFTSPLIYNNLHDIPQDSAYLAVSGMWLIERNFGKHTLDIEFDIYAKQYLEFEQTNGEEYSAKFSYNHEINQSLNWSNKYKFQYGTDDECDIFGNNYIRDFSFHSHQVQTALDWKLNDSHKIDTSVSYKQKDYSEIDAINSIDWDESRFRTAYRWKISDQFKFRCQHDISQQSYDEELSNNAANGLELLSNPPEKHNFNKTTVAFYWYGQSDSKIWIKYALKHKEDSFEGFESYNENQFRIGVLSHFTQHCSLKAEYTAKERDFELRPGTNFSNQLLYNVNEFNVSLRRNLSDHRAISLGYARSERDSNRNFGEVYRNYIVNAALLTYSFYY